MVPVLRHLGVMQLWGAMVDGETRHGHHFRTGLPITRERLQARKEPLEAVHVMPPLPGGIVEAAEQEQVVHLMGLELHRRRRQQPQAAVAAMSRNRCSKVSIRLGPSSPKTRRRAAWASSTITTSHG